MKTTSWLLAFITWSMVFCTHIPEKGTSKAELDYGLQMYRVHGTLIQEWHGVPIFLADWDGLREPYTLDDKSVRPVLPAIHRQAKREYESIRILSENQLLLVKRPPLGSLVRSVYFYDSEKEILKEVSGIRLSNSLGLCVAKDSRQVAWLNEEGSESYALLTETGSLLQGSQFSRQPGLESCKWFDSKKLIGIERVSPQSSVPGHTNLLACEISNPSCKLMNTPDIYAGGAVTLWETPREAGVLMYSRKLNRRIPYRFSVGAKHLEPIQRLPPGPENVTGYDGRNFKLGLHQRDFLDVAPSAPEAVYGFANVGKKIFGIVGGAGYSPTIAELVDGAWQPYFYGTYHDLPDLPVHEIWVRSDEGHFFLTSYYGRGKNDQAVLYFTGADATRPSAYYPFVHAIQNAGYDVFWVRYVGPAPVLNHDSGHIDRETAREAGRAILKYVRQNDYKRIIAWGISGGNFVTEEYLNGSGPISGLVDYLNNIASAQRKTDRLREIAKERGFHFFAVRAKYDTPEFDRIEVLLPTRHADNPPLNAFLDLMSAVTKFMNETPLLPLPVVTNEKAAWIDPLPSPEGFKTRDHYFIGDAAAELSDHLMKECQEATNYKNTTYGFPTLHRNFPWREKGSPAILIESGPDKRDAILNVSGQSDSIDRAVKLLSRATGFALQNQASVEPCTIRISLYDDGEKNWRRKPWQLTREGIVIRPRLRQLAQKICPALELVRTCNSASEPES
jgi:hypothetical protein